MTFLPCLPSNTPQSKENARPVGKIGAQRAAPAQAGLSNIDGSFFCVAEAWWCAIALHIIMLADAHLSKYSILTCLPRNSVCEPRLSQIC